MLTKKGRKKVRTRGRKGKQREREENVAYKEGEEKG